MRTFLLALTVVVVIEVPLLAQRVQSPHPAAVLSTSENGDFRIPPYVQNPTLEEITITWFSNEATPGQVVIGDTSGPLDTLFSEPEEVPELEYPAWEVDPDDFPGGAVPDPPFRHRVRVEGLTGNKEHWYRVAQAASVFESTFRTAPGIRDSIRFIVYGDSETEPVPARPFAVWSDPADPDADRRYLMDQETGYANNLRIIRERDPNFVAIAGDLVQAGGEQLDWDEFWRHNTHRSNADSSLAGRSPIVPVPGNHEYFSSPHSFSNDTPKAYRQPWSSMAMDKYSAYFEVPDNGSTSAKGRYFRFDYGPVGMIGVDVCNNGANQNPDDTNFQLLGDVDAEGGNAPSFSPGTEQYDWLESALQDARLERPFVFVLLHYAPYSVGPHGWEPGLGTNEDALSGVPVRQLTPLFMQYGVDAVFAGHDEMWERSVIEGFEERPDGSMRPHVIHFFDVGTGGDDLRGPQEGLQNPFQEFLVHTDVPEQWENGALIDGGKHYGHLEVDVRQVRRDEWEAVLTPVYSFPVLGARGYVDSERREYDDTVTLHASDSLRALGVESVWPEQPGIAGESAFPNPTAGSTRVTFVLGRPASVTLLVFDAMGRRIRTLQSGSLNSGHQSVLWDGRDHEGRPAASGVYFVRIRAEGESRAIPLLITR